MTPCCGPRGDTEVGNGGTVRVFWRWARLATVYSLFALVISPSAAPAGLGQSRPESQAGEAAPQDSPERHLGRGYADLKNDRYEEAVREFRAALALKPQWVFRARFPLAVSLFELHKLKEARREFEAVRSQVGDHPDVMYYIGRLDMMEGNYDGAIHELTQAAANPPFQDTAYYLGSAYLKNKEFAPAEKWLHTAAKTAPKDFRVQESLGLLYRQEGRKDEAQKSFELAGELQERDAEVSGERIACIQKLQTGSLPEARAVCERLFDTNDVEKLTMLGTIYGQHGDYAEALKPLRRAAELNPNSPQMQYNLALDCFRLKRYAEARTALSGAVKQWPDLFELNSLLGVVLYRLGEDPAAYRVLSHAHDLNPQDAETADFLCEVAVILARRSHERKQDAVSLRYLKTAAEVRPRDPDPHRLMAEIYSAMGQQEQASQERREAERLTAPNAVNPK
ncbi:MAG: tetratricopeptide repeat protein [Terriglobia bacterium]